MSVHLGDCLPWLRAMPPAGVDSVVTDLPYGMNLRPQRERNRAIANDGRREARALWYGVVSEAHRIARPDSAHIFFGRWSEAWAKEVLAEWFTVKGCIVWRKHNFGLGYYLRPQHELIWYCHKGSPPPPARAQSDVWDCPRVHMPEHSCEKPVPLMERCIDLVCPPGGLVVDPCCGVGSTGVACANTGRRFAGCELDPGYHREAAERIARVRKSDEGGCQDQPAPF